MNYLELCRMLARESGMNLTGPTSVIGNDGTQYSHLIDWIGAAYTEIQLKHRDWIFMRKPFSLVCTSGVGEYSSSDVNSDAQKGSVSHFDTMSAIVYRQSAGKMSAVSMKWLPYETFEGEFMSSSLGNAEGMPQFYSSHPSERSLLLWPIPGSDTYVVEGHFYRKPHVLSQNSDEPIFPSEYHMLIVYWALWKYGGFEESSSVYMNAQAQVRNYIARMENEFLPHVYVGGTFV